MLQLYINSSIKITKNEYRYLLSYFPWWWIGKFNKVFLWCYFKKIIQTNLPFGTFIANMISCLIVGFILFLFRDKIQQNTWITPLFIIGFCGGLSTFSTFSNETAELINQGNLSWAIINVITSLLFGIGMIYWLRFKI